ncbi:MAG: hypothetical protein ABIC82_00305 [bacterium]
MFRLSDKQVSKLADISSDIAILALASVVLPAILDRYDLFSALIGLWVTLFCWLISIWLLNNL